MQRHDAVAPRGVGERLRVVTAFVISNVVPRITSARFVCELGGIRVQHNERQGDGAVAAAGGLQGVRVIACRGERLPEEVVTAALADLRRHWGVVEGINRQGEGNHAVTAADRLQGVRVSSLCGEDLPEEVVAVAVADGRRDGCVIDRVHRQSQRNHAVATVDRL